MFLKVDHLAQKPGLNRLFFAGISLHNPAQIYLFCAESDLKLHKLNTCLPLFRLKLVFFAVGKYPEKGCSRRPFRPFWSQPASLMVISVRVGSRKALVLFNLRSGFVLPPQRVCTTSSAGLYYLLTLFVKNRLKRNSFKGPAAHS